jgi:hypothetical protein
MIAAKLQDVLAKFQTVYFTQCLEQCDCWAYCMKAKEGYFEGDITQPNNNNKNFLVPLFLGLFLGLFGALIQKNALDSFSFLDMVEVIKF